MNGKNEESRNQSGACRVCVFVNKSKVNGRLNSLFTEENKRKWMFEKIEWGSEFNLEKLPVVIKKGPNNLGVAQVFLNKTSFEEEALRAEYYITPFEVYVVPVRVLQTITNLSTKEFHDILDKCQKSDRERRKTYASCQQVAAA